MTSANTLSQAREALKGFLATIIGTDAPLVFESPVGTTLHDSQAGMARRTVVLGQTAQAPGNFAVLLDEGWLPLMSQAMLGEAMDLSSDGAVDLLRELAGQAFGAVRTELGGAGILLGEMQFDIFAPGSALPEGALTDLLTEIPFSMKSNGQNLTGSALLPRVAEKKVPIAPASFADLGSEQVTSSGDGHGANFSLLAEVELEITVELGRRRLPLADMLRLTTGSVIELEKLVGEPLEVYANGRLIAEGEAVVIDEQFGIRITNLASTRQRYKAFL